MHHVAVAVYPKRRKTIAQLGRTGMLRGTDPGLKKLPASAQAPDADTQLAHIQGWQAGVIAGTVDACQESGIADRLIQAIGGALLVDVVDMLRLVERDCP